MRQTGLEPVFPDWQPSVLASGRLQHVWCGRRGSNSRSRFGRPVSCHWTTPAHFVHVQLSKNMAPVVRVELTGRGFGDHTSTTASPAYLVRSGATDRIRTGKYRGHNPALSPSSLSRTATDETWSRVSAFNQPAPRYKGGPLSGATRQTWRARRDLNPRLLPYQGSGLPLTYKPETLEDTMGLEPTPSRLRGERTATRAPSPQTWRARRESNPRCPVDSRASCH